MSEPSKEGVARQIVATTVAGYLIQPVMFFSNLVVRRELGPFLTGVFATLTIVQTYTQLCNLGVLQAAERDLPMLRGAQEQSRFESVRTVSFLIALATGLIGGCGVVGYAILRQAALDPSLFRGLLVYGLMVVLTQWANAQLGLLRANLQFTFLARFNTITAVLAAVLNIVGVYLAGFDGLLAATLVVAVTSCVVYTRVAGLPVLAGATAQFLPQARVLLVAGVPLLVMASVHSVLHTIGNVMALELLGTEWLGKYTLALSAGAVLYSFANSVTTVLFPHMQMAWGKERTPRAFGPFVERPVRMLAAGLPVLIAPLFWGLPVLVRAMLPRFIPGIPAFQVLIVGIVFYAVAQLPHLTLYSMDKISLLVGWTLTTVGVAAGCSWLFTHAGLELAGIALAVSVSHLVFFVGLSAFAMVHWMTRRAVATFVVKTCATVAAAAALLAGVEALPFPEPGGFLSDIALGCARIALFLVLYYPLLLLTDRETALLRDHVYPTVRRVWGRLVPGRVS